MPISFDEMTSACARQIRDSRGLLGVRPAESLHAGIVRLRGVLDVLSDLDRAPHSRDAQHYLLAHLAAHVQIIAEDLGLTTVAPADLSCGMGPQPVSCGMGFQPVSFCIDGAAS